MFDGEVVSQLQRMLELDRRLRPRSKHFKHDATRLPHHIFFSLASNHYYNFIFNPAYQWNLPPDLGSFSPDFTDLSPDLGSFSPDVLDPDLGSLSPDLVSFSPDVLDPDLGSLSLESEYDKNIMHKL